MLDPSQSIILVVCNNMQYLVGGFQHVLFLTIPRDDYLIDNYFGDGLQAPSSSPMITLIMCEGL